MLFERATLAELVSLFHQGFHALEDVLDGMNALHLMTLGLMQAKDPYAAGMNVISNYLKDTVIEAKTLLAGMASEP